MRARCTLTAVGSHAGDEIGNVIGGVLPPPGATVLDLVAVHANLIVPTTLRLEAPAGTPHVTSDRHHSINARLIPSWLH
jgi:proline racemase